MLHEWHLAFEFDHGNFKKFKPTKHDKMVNPFDMWWCTSVPNFSLFEECKVTKWSRRSSFGVDGHDRHTRYLIYEGEYAKWIYFLMFSIFHGHYLTQIVKVSYFSNQLWIIFEFYKIWSNKGWPDDVESIWIFLDRPTGVVSSKCDIAWHHIVFDRFAEVIVVHASRMETCFQVWLR
jgi:hypothetical protein